MNIYTNKTVLNQLVTESRQTFFGSSFGFVNETKGWRKEKVHLFLAKTGGGKTTLVRTIILDILSNPDKRIGLYLSEETEKEFYTELAFSGYQDIGEFKRVFVYSEQAQDKVLSVRDTLGEMKRLCDENRVDILIVDNATTLSSYSDNLKNQEVITKGVKKLATVNDIPVIVIAHTDAKFKDGLIDPNDIRGSKALVNEAHFIYAVQGFEVDGKRHNYVFIKKHRGQPVKNSLYQLYYYDQARIFAKDEIRPFELFREAFTKRDKL